MAIYDVTRVDFSATLSHELKPNEVVVMPFTLADGEQVSFSLLQYGHGDQDFSVRAWVSKHPYGASVFPQDSLFDNWMLQRVVSNNMGMYTGDEFIPVDAIPVESKQINAGNYYLNCLNVTNGKTGFVGTVTIS